MQSDFILQSSTYKVVIKSINRDAAVLSVFIYAILKYNMKNDFYIGSIKNDYYDFL